MSALENEGVNEISCDNRIDISHPLAEGLAAHAEAFTAFAEASATFGELLHTV